jgi:glycosyltransferase involved in cell wall biosynthesis
MQTVVIAHPSADLYGSDRVMLETVTAMTDRQWRVVVSVPAPGPLVSEIEARGAEVRICPSPVLRKSALKPLGMLRLIWDVLRSVPAGIGLIRSVRADLIYVSTITVPLWFVLGRLLRRPVVGHVHEAERAAPKLIRKALTAPLLLADRLLVNSRFSLQVLTESFPSLGSTATVLYNGVPGPPHLTPARDRLEGPMRLLYIGRLSPRKGPQVAVDAVNDLRNRDVSVTLDLIGAVFPGYEWFETQLRDRVAAAGLTDGVFFRGFQPDIWQAVSAADLVLIPSQADEPFGNSAVEAVLAARPVIASASSGLLEAVDGYESAQTVAPTDLAGWCDAILRVRQHWTEYRENAISDARLAHDRHAPERYRAGVAAELTDLVNRTNRPRALTHD